MTSSLSHLRSLLRIGTFGVVLCFYFLTTLPFYPWTIKYPNRVRPFLIRLVAFYCSVMLKVLGIKVKMNGNTEYLNNPESYLVVANHMSYIDMLVMASQRSGCFVTSMEMRNMIGLGQIAMACGCVFVDRKNKSNIHNEIGEVRDALIAGMDVIVYPEATSTDASGIVRFRRPMFEGSIMTGKKVLPVTLNYVSIDGEPLSVLNRDVLCWYGDMEFFPHFLILTSKRQFVVEMTVSTPIDPTGLTSLDLAQRAQQVVAGHYRPIVNPASVNHDLLEVT